MRDRISENRMVWLMMGLMAGVSLAYFWPHEPAQAVTSDSNDKIGIATCSTTIAGADAVFVLDFLTGRLQGAVLNQRTGKFTQSYFRNIAADFQVNPQNKPSYTIVSGVANLPSQGNMTRATGVIYVAEMSSGRVAAYSFPFRESPRPIPPVQMQPLDFFQFREPQPE